MQRITTTLDTDANMRAQQAARFGSLPEWLSEDGSRDFLTEHVLAKDSLTLPEPPYPRGITIDNVIDIFVASNVALRRITNDTQRDLMLRILNRSGGSEAAKIGRMEDAWRNRDRIMIALRRQIEDNRAAVTAWNRFSSDFEQLRTHEFTPYEVDHVQFTIKLATTVATTPSLYSLFDGFTASSHVPYIAMSTDDNRDAFKVFKDFEINPEWLSLRLTDVIMLKVDSELLGQRPLTAKFGRYTTAAVTVTDSTIIATMDTPIDARSVTKAEFIQRVVSANPDLVPIAGTERDNVIIVRYMIPHACINQIVFQEFIMNDPLASRVAAIDETTAAAKSKAYSIYVHRLGTADTVTLTEKVTTKHNELGAAGVPGTKFLRCRMRVSSTDEIVRWQTIVGKLISGYNAAYDAIVNDYHRFLPDFRPTTCSIKSKTTKTRAFEELGAAAALRSIAPEIFAAKYSRRCANAPSIADANTTGQTMRFPAHGESSPPRVYTCNNNPTHPFIGLRVNDLATKKEFPYVPCCFAQDQQEKKGSTFRKYFFGEQERGVARAPQDTVVAAQHVLEPKRLGALPLKLQAFFTSIDTDPNVAYMRLGIELGRLAAIEAILVGKGRIKYGNPLAAPSARIIQPYTTQSRKTIDAMLDKEMGRIATPEFAMAAKQELFDIDLLEIIREMRESDLRPSRFVHALEMAFDCNIFVFSATTDPASGELLVPRHARAYYKFKPSRDIFFLFEHWGAVDEQLTHPHVELIVRVAAAQQRPDLSFLPGDAVVDRVFDVFGRMTHSLINGRDIQAIKMRRQIPVDEQTVDSFGKCRSVRVGNVVLNFVDPLPPFAARPMADERRQSPSIADVKRLVVEQLGGVIDSEHDNEVRVTVGGVEAIVVVGVGSDRRMASDDNKRIGETRRAAAILKDYALWTLSIWLNGKPLSPVDDMTKFAAAKLVTVPDTQRMIGLFSSNEFTQSVGGPLDGSGRLRVPSSAMKSLLFACRQFALTFPERLSEYKRLKAIPSFYQTFSDNATAHVMGSVEEMNRLVETYSAPTMEMHSSVLVGGASFFFRNPLVGAGTTFLSVPVPSLEKANAMLTAWLDRGIMNDATATEAVETDAVAAIFSFVNALDISRIADGNVNEIDGCILGFKVNGVPTFLLLFPISSITARQ